MWTQGKGCSQIRMWARRWVQGGGGAGERMAEPRMAALWEMSLERTSKAKCPN